VAVSTTRALFGLPSVAAGAESAPSPISLITLEVKSAGKRRAGKRQAAFDVAGAGNVTRGAGLRAIVKTVEWPPDPTVGAPVFDPTGAGERLKSPTYRHRGREALTHPVLDNMMKVDLLLSAY
jgi:hypothetical protein